MRSNIKPVMMKEFKRFFSDKRMVFTTLLMPGLMVYLMYSLMGQAFSKEYAEKDNYVAKVYVQSLPDSFQSLKESDTVKLLDNKNTLDEMKEEVKNKDADVLIVFPENFDEKVENYDCQTSSEQAPNVEVYYNSSSTDSYNTYDNIITMLETYETCLANKFDVNHGDEDFDLVTKEDSTGKTFSTILPMLMMIFLFSGCLAVAPESIAGEKERGTIATLLVTPAKRSDIAIGKIISLSVIALLSGASSFLGTILSMPKLMQMESSEVSAAVYGMNDYVMLLLIILSTVLVLISLISVISAFAKTVKEATTYVTPLMLVVCLIGISSMLTGGATEKLYLYLIPCYNSVQCMSSIFGFSYNIINIVITVVSNIVVAGILVVMLEKMFKSEKMMY